jgi:8-oxo-dGTP pyrophosphatase MutT (NUDIX family)
MKEAASLLLCQFINSIKFKILFVKRPPFGSFQSCHVFPGGAVSVHDAHNHMTALRETFEETGALVMDPPVKMSLETSLEWRTRIHAHPFLFHALLSQFNQSKLTPCLPWAHWITPVHEKKRFNTWFYLTFLNQKHPLDSISPDLKETLELEWMTPKEAIDAFKIQKRIQFFPPQYLMLLELAQITSVDLQRMIQNNQTRSMDPICPELIEKRKQEVRLVLPGDYRHSRTKTNHSKECVELILKTLDASSFMDIEYIKKSID